MRIRHSRLVTLILLLFLAGVFGCHAGHRVIGRTIPPPNQQDCRMPNAFEDLQTRHELATLVSLPHERQRIIDETSAIIDSGSPFMVAAQMMNLSNFLPSQVKQETLRPLMEKCLASADPVIRW